MQEKTAKHLQKPAKKWKKNCKKELHKTAHHQKNHLKKPTCSERASDGPLNQISLSYATNDVPHQKWHRTAGNMQEANGKGPLTESALNVAVKQEHGGEFACLIKYGALLCQCSPRLKDRSTSTEMTGRLRSSATWPSNIPFGLTKTTKAKWRQLLWSSFCVLFFIQENSKNFNQKLFITFRKTQHLAFGNPIHWVRKTPARSKILDNFWVLSSSINTSHALQQQQERNAESPSISCPLGINQTGLKLYPINLEWMDLEWMLKLLQRNSSCK